MLDQNILAVNSCLRIRTENFRFHFHKFLNDSRITKRFTMSESGEKPHSGDEDAALKSVFERQMPATGQPFIFRSFL